MTPASSYPCLRESLEACSYWQWRIVSEMFCEGRDSLHLPVIQACTGLASPRGSLEAGGSTVLPLPPNGVTMMPL